jgi:hypothetical protein
MGKLKWEMRERRKKIKKGRMGMKRKGECRKRARE